jgi:hypothetical protein
VMGSFIFGTLVRRPLMAKKSGRSKPVTKPSIFSMSS